MSLYENINKRRKAGTSRPKSKSTIEPKAYAKMKAKRGGFAAKRRR
jgi:hypothetical protein